MLWSLCYGAYAMEPIEALMNKGISPYVFVFLSYLLFLVIFSLCLCLRVRLLQLRQQLLHIRWHRVLLVDEVGALVPATNVGVCVLVDHIVVGRLAEHLPLPLESVDIASILLRLLLLCRLLGRAATRLLLLLLGLLLHRLLVRLLLLLGLLGLLLGLLLLLLGHLLLDQLLHLLHHLLRLVVGATRHTRLRARGALRLARRRQLAYLGLDPALTLLENLVVVPALIVGVDRLEVGAKLHILGIVLERDLALLQHSRHALLERPPRLHPLGQGALGLLHRLVVRAARALLLALLQRHSQLGHSRRHHLHLLLECCDIRHLDSLLHCLSPLKEYWLLGPAGLSIFFLNRNLP